ncbi:MAG: Aspartate-semialdehyde dehydrogenase, partial [uncultured Microvirga sp.]
GIQGRGRRRHRSGRARDPQDPGRARLPREGGGGARLRPLRRLGAVLRREGHAQGAEPGEVRLPGHGHRPVFARRLRVGGPRAARRRRRLRGDRQHQPLPHGAGRAAGGAGGEPAGPQALQQAQHHRQPELLHHPDGRGAEAAARRGARPPRGGGDLPVGVRRRKGGHGRALQPDPRRVRERPGAARAVPQGDRLQLHPAHRPLHGRRLHQGRVEDGGGNQEDPGPRHLRGRHLRPRAGVRRPRRGDQRRVREPDRRRAGPRPVARSARRAARGPARGRRLRHAQRGGRRGRRVRLAPPPRPDGAERPRLLVRVRQPPQGSGAERGADRGGAGGAGADPGQASGL